MSPHVRLLLIGAIVEVFEHDKTEGSRHLEMADVRGTLHEDFQSIGSAAEDVDFDRIDGIGHLHADVRGKLHGDFRGDIGAVAVDFDFD